MTRIGNKTTVPQWSTKKQHWVVLQRVIRFKIVCNRSSQRASYFHHSKLSMFQNIFVGKKSAAASEMYVHLNDEQVNKYFNNCYTKKRRSPGFKYIPLLWFLWNKYLFIKFIKFFTICFIFGLNDNANAKKFRNLIL